MEPQMQAPCKATGLTMLSFGGGQDSTCILYRIILEPEFRSRYVSGRLVVVFSDTGNEHPHTYNHLQYIASLCRTHRIEFYWLRPEMGYHPRTWTSLQHQFSTNNTIMSIAFPRTCTDNLKIKPIYNFLDKYIATRFYARPASDAVKGKRFIKQFSARHGKIRVLIGLSKGEERRIAGTSTQLDLFRPLKSKEALWMSKCLEKSYPLITEQMDRSACQRYIREHGMPLPFPSNCIMCPFISRIELLWLYRNLPDEFARWVKFERMKMTAHQSAKRNLGVKGERTLEQILAEAIAEYGSMSDSELQAHKMSHGHCVSSKF